MQRNFNFMGGMRVDVPHFRMMESAVTAEFQTLAGEIMAGGDPVVVTGFTIPIAAGAVIGQSASLLTMVTAGGILMHPLAAESGSIFTVPADRAAEVLNGTNARVVGQFTDNATNYVGIDLIRLKDTSTTDVVTFLNANTKAEFTQTIPLARNLDYRIYIQTTDFDHTGNILPIAIVGVDANGAVSLLTDARPMAFRLGVGGTNASATTPFATMSTRVENPITLSAVVDQDPFVGGDKGTSSLRGWMASVMNRLWELGGGAHWYAQATPQDLKLTYDPTKIFSQSGENWYLLDAAHASATATLVNAAVGNKLTIAGVDFSAVAAVVAPNQWLQTGDDTADAAALANAINGSTTPGIPGVVIASSNVNVVTVTAVDLGTGGNSVTIAKTGAPITLAGATGSHLNGGADGTAVLWAGLRVFFAQGENGATYNTIADQTSASVGLTDLADGDCLYVDVDRTSNASLTAHKIDYENLYTTPPTIPGSRFVIAWKNLNRVYVTGQTTTVNSGGYSYATTGHYGIVRLMSISSDRTGEAVCATADTSGRVVGSGLRNPGPASTALNIGTTSYDTTINIGRTGQLVTIPSTVTGINSVATASLPGVYGEGGPGGNAVGGSFKGGSTSGTGIYAEGTGGKGGGYFLGQGAGVGVEAYAGATAGTIAVYGSAVNNTTGTGVKGIGGTSSGTGVVGEGGTNGIGVQGRGFGTGAGVNGVAINGHGVVAEADTGDPSPDKSALRIVPQDADPNSSPATGDIYVHSTGGKINASNGTTFERYVPQCFASVADAAEISGSAASDLGTASYAAFDQKYTIPAASLRVGSTIRVRGAIERTAMSGADVAAVKLYIGGSDICILLGSDIVVGPGDGCFDAVLTLRTVGGSAQGRVAVMGMADSTIGRSVSRCQAFTATFNSNNSADLEVRVGFGSANSGNKMKLHQLVVDIT